MTCIFNGERGIPSYVAIANCRVHNSLLLYITIYAYVANTVADEINMVCLSTMIDYSVGQTSV